MAVQHGMIYRWHNGYIHASRPPELRLADRTYVFGRWERDLLLDQQRLPRRTRSRVGGSPRLDLVRRGADDRAAVRARARASRADDRTGRGLRDVGPIYRRFHYPIALAGLVDRPLPGVHLVVKLHPGEPDEGPYRAVIEGVAAAARLRAAADHGRPDDRPVPAARCGRRAPRDPLDGPDRGGRRPARRTCWPTALAAADLLGYVEAGVAIPVARRRRPARRARRAADGAIDARGPTRPSWRTISSPGSRASGSPTTCSRGCRDRPDPVPRPRPRRQPAGARARTCGPSAGIPLVGRAGRTARLAAAGAARRAAPRRLQHRRPGDRRGRARAWGADVVRPARGAGHRRRDVGRRGAPRPRGARGGDGDVRTLVLLQPTSPLTDPADLVAAVERFIGRRAAPGHERHGDAPGRVASRDGRRRRRCVAASAGERRPASADRRRSTSSTPRTLARTRRFVEPGGHDRPVVAAGASVDIDDGRRPRRSPRRSLAARAVRPVPIGDRGIGAGPVFVIAEAGVNHDGDPAVAHRAHRRRGRRRRRRRQVPDLRSRRAGAPQAPRRPRTSARRRGAGDQREMLRRLALPAEAWAGAPGARRASAGSCSSRRRSTTASADLLDALGVPAFKVGSGELTNLPFLARLAAPRPADAAVDRHGRHGRGRRGGRRGRAPPATRRSRCSTASRATRRAPADANLRAIETMRRAFGVPVGWSDHTPGIELARRRRRALGATLIEKHLTLDRTLPGPDHARVARARRVRGAWSRAIRAVEAALGDGDKVPVAAERDDRRASRGAACTGRRSLRGRDRRSARATCVALRPGTGLAPALAATLVGRRTGPHGAAPGRWSGPTTSRAPR